MAARQREWGIRVSLAEKPKELERNALRAEMHSETGFSTIWVLMVFMLAKLQVARCTGTSRLDTLMSRIFKRMILCFCSGG